MVSSGLKGRPSYLLSRWNVKVSRTRQGQLRLARNNKLTPRLMSRHDTKASPEGEIRMRGPVEGQGLGLGEALAHVRFLCLS